MTGVSEENESVRRSKSFQQRKNSFCSGRKRLDKNCQRSCFPPHLQSFCTSTGTVPGLKVDLLIWRKCAERLAETRLWKHAVFLPSLLIPVHIFQALGCSPAVTMVNNHVMMMMMMMSVSWPHPLFFSPRKWNLCAEFNAFGPASPRQNPRRISEKARTKLSA
jgi:hypothetical protein